MAKNKKFYRIPREIAGMTDAEIDAWAKSVYQDFVGFDIKCFPIAKDMRPIKITPEAETRGGEE